MVRWEPGSQGRLQEAAMTLYGERGYDNVTVAEIAAHVGLTERTFFRHFADKREVLFAGGTLLQDAFVAAVHDASAGASPMDAAAAVLDAAGEVFRGRVDHARARQGIIAGSAELRERELIKLATLTNAVAEALRARGVAEPAASLTAEVVMAVFRVSFERWVAKGTKQDLAPLMQESLAELRAVTSIA